MPLAPDKNAPLLLALTPCGRGDLAIMFAVLVVMYRERIFLNA